MIFSVSNIIQGNKAIQKELKGVKTNMQKISYSEKYLDKSYNIISHLNKNGFQTVSSFKVVKPGSKQFIDTNEGKKEVVAGWADVLYTNPDGKKSIIPVGDIAEKYFVENDAKKVLIAVAQDALENNQVKYRDYDAHNDFYVVKTMKYLPTEEIKEKVNGLVDKNKDEKYVSVYERKTDTYSYLC